MEYSFTPALLDRNVCRDFGRASKLEWLNTNNTGAYAMGTIAGVNTRGYHGLLVASLHQPVQRNVLLSKVDEQVTIGDLVYDLATNQYPGVVHPRGFELLDTFRMDPFPEWSWQLGPVSITKQVFLVPDKQAVVVLYSSSGKCSIRATPFLAFRDYHSLRHANTDLDGKMDAHPDYFKIRPYSNLPAMTFHNNGKSFEETGLWYYNFEYLLELERGMDFQEDLYAPGAIHFELDGGQKGFFVASVCDDTRYDLDTAEHLIKKLQGDHVTADSPFQVKLTAASDQFRANRADGRPTLMAGFPWFADWGRDTMISLPGLLITRGMLDDAVKIIESFLIHLNQGIIPNHYPDFGTPEYNTCDATLWMFQAVWSYMQNGGTLAWIQDVFYPASKNIMEWHQRGTLYDIRMDPEDGLLSAGVKGTQLTWMDAKVDDWVVTPRHGKPVEVNALWFNALRMSAHWATEFGDAGHAREMMDMAERARHSFEQKFWNPARNCLYDVLGFQGPIAKLRPNQIFAVSLPFSLFDREKQQAIVGIVEKELLTTVGLRTLERNDPDYRPRYEGDRVHRDGAYHQGTVWPWLLGPFVTAYLKAFGTSDDNVAYCRKIIGRLEPEMLVDCIGNLNEIYDGDEPHLPRGCIAQAWSVGEVLRVLRSELA